MPKGIIRSNAPEIKRGARTYVTVAEAARRLNLTDQAVRHKVNNGSLLKHNFREFPKNIYVDLEQTQKLFANPQTKEGIREKQKREERKRANALAHSSQDGLAKGKEVGQVKTSSVKADGKLESMQVLKSGDGKVIGMFDTEDPANADLYLLNDYGEPALLPDGRHMIDWKKADTKATAMIRHLQYAKETEEVIPKRGVIEVLSRVFPLYINNVQQMPERFATRICGRVEEFLGRSMTNDEYTIVKNSFVSEAERICNIMVDALNAEYIAWGEPPLELDAIK